MLFIRTLRITFPLLAMALGWAANTAVAAEIPLGDIGLEDLMKLDVVTVSRKAQKLSDTPAAVTVLTAEDLRRSGARSIPEALRGVPGVEVAQIGAGRYAVSIRGFNGRFSNKLLVQVDGRSVYSPFFSGVFWEALNLMLEDIERIEVIRGPGASLWGANAVNGVINIVTRRASTTQGMLVSETIDDQGHSDTAVRYGTTIQDIGALRIYARGAEVSPSQWADGSQAPDGLRGGRAGFRLDSAVAEGRSWMLQGEAYVQETHETFALPALVQQYGLMKPTFSIRHEGADLLGRVTRQVGGGEIAVQAYLDQSRALLQSGKGTVDTVDVDFQHRLEPLGQHELLWGAGYRYARTELTGVEPLLRADPNSRRLRTASAFIQDEITLEPLRWKLTLGAKAEDSSLSGFEFQPNVRLMWTPTAADSVWTGWSRAARTPSVGESDAKMVVGVQQLPPGYPFPAVGLVNRLQPGYEMRAERLDAFELGYRRNLGNGSFEAVAFVDEYKRVLGTVSPAGGPVFPGTIVLPFPPYSLPDVYIDRANPLAGRGTGFELGVDAPLTAAVRLQAAYTWQKLDLGHYDDPVTAQSASRIENSSPRHSANVRLVTTLAPGHEFDVAVRYVSEVQSGEVPAYTAVDLRYSWKVNRNFELAIIGQNLFDPSHLEFVTDFFPAKPTYQPRRAFIQGIVHF